MFLRVRLVLALALGGVALAGVGASGCRGLRPARPPGTVWAPAFDPAGAARMGAEAAAGGPVVLARHLRRFGLPPTGADSVAQGWVAGRYPLRASELVVVAVPARSGAASLGPWLDVARLSAALSPWRLYPEPTLLFAALDGSPAEGIDGLRRAALWAPDSVRTVVFLGTPGEASAAAAATRRWGVRLVSVAPGGRPEETAERLFDAVRREAWGLGAPSDTARVAR